MCLDRPPTAGDRSQLLEQDSPVADQSMSLGLRRCRWQLVTVGNNTGRAWTKLECQKPLLEAFITGAAVERSRGKLMRPSRTALDDARRTGTGLLSKAVQKQLRRVLASDGFRNSRRMTNLLRFVVSETLAGHERRLKEYVIAVEAFDRDKSFDPRTNAVVRVRLQSEAGPAGALVGGRSQRDDARTSEPNGVGGARGRPLLST